MSTEKTLKAEDLDQFNGAENWYQHGLVRSVLYTDGAKYVAENGGAYWLLDEIAIGQMNPVIRKEPFQSWKLKLTGKNSAVLTVEDGNYHEILRKYIPFTDFPLPEVTLWLEEGYVNAPGQRIVMLPSER